MIRLGLTEPAGRIVASWLCALTAALALSAAAGRTDRLPWDLALTRWVQRWPAALESPAEWIRAVTGTETSLSLGVALVATALLRRRVAIAAATAAMLIALPFVQGGVKDLVDRPRPDPALVERRAGFSSPSFPAGHVMSGTVLAVVAGLVVLPELPRRARPAVALGLTAFAMANGAANVYEGVHWPSDVAGGYLWATVIALPGIATVPVLRARGSEGR